MKAKTKTKRLSEENKEPPQNKGTKRKRLSSHSKNHKHKDKHKRHRGETPLKLSHQLGQ